ncbi:P-loop containing nucleoside triphosphate hydrolase protein [Diplogelasinospora grovesii]|uniref:P-loop containing nucleoside triphosphate hydrolase protein n=1 Tax=Diplogelasinospora grovesii TaxID=303347 RepID=A0AAN6N305_9PEZI|nr:P-loop containing nucleoside triphosphate hydrolase protein [Diplogelasinospora grovesii]
MPYSTAPSANESSDNSFDAPPTASPPLRAPVLSVHTIDGFISSSAIEQPAMRPETIHTALPSPSHHWDEKSGKYRIISLTDSGDNELNRYVFMARDRIDETTSYIDIKSALLRDVLREICRGIRGVSLADRNILFHIREELSLRREHHLNLLVEYTETTYSLTAKHLSALFQPNIKVYTTCPGTGALRCIIYNTCEERTEMDGSKYMYVEGRYLNSDRKSLSEATTGIKIPNFPYPLQYHSEQESASQFKLEDVDPGRLKEQDFLICSLTVFRFSLDSKVFLKFTVANISEVEWSYGPPNVGKTLTAETLAESLKIPLYAVPAGQIGVDPVKVEAILTTKAILLINEADIFMAQRSNDHLQLNALVSVFLRELEQFNGILFLTTNRLQTFDEAILSRIHVSLKYNDLGRNAREAVWRHFVERAVTKRGPPAYSDTVFEELAERNMNGREIRNAVFIAQSMAEHEGTVLNGTHLKDAIASKEQFYEDFNGAGAAEKSHIFF